MTKIPDYLKWRPVQRGMAVPWGATIDNAGVAHFAINDTMRMMEAVDDDKCFLCGRPLFMKRWFIGGARSAFHPRGAYLDPPTHRDCAHYALQVCPYIAAPTYGKEVAHIKAEAAGEAMAGIIHRTDESATKGRPPGDLFVAVEAIEQDIVGGGRYLKPRMPYRKVEFWRRGKEITAFEASRIIEEAAPDLMEFIAFVADEDTPHRPHG